MARRRSSRSRNRRQNNSLLTWIAIALLVIFLIRAYEGFTKKPLINDPQYIHFIDSIDPVKGLTN